MIQLFQIMQIKFINRFPFLLFDPVDFLFKRIFIINGILIGINHRQRKIYPRIADTLFRTKAEIIQFFAVPIIDNHLFSSLLFIVKEIIINGIKASVILQSDILSSLHVYIMQKLTIKRINMQLQLSRIRKINLFQTLIICHSQDTFRIFARSLPRSTDLSDKFPFKSKLEQLFIIAHEQIASGNSNVQDILFQ